MENQNYTTTIEFAESPKDVFNHVNDVSNWQRMQAKPFPDNIVIKGWLLNFIIVGKEI